ncbi:MULTISPECIES: hypothetical protein [unclassified Mesorhizobium]|uniref:hypothetical protein n=1 Tax=unclassified Mesorhizobium TaxID=325217 RepID=UPI001CCF520C|nr:MULTISPECIES: hypothetical protein [unclassified Mesorhizobium]MBZ9916517.1 hypothetical protein [Mesorhizobium sp. BR1-1-7]MBZ9951452.1 hypothetical protein [Mesorhizobium sp. BR1-1-15]MBZ9968798.1 hypothetical protein [Mesorhizobium sp. BR1-1-12]
MPDLLLELRSEEIPAQPARPQRRRREDARTGKWHAGGGTLMPDLLLELRSEEIPAQPRARSAGGARTREQENGMRAETL